jgi:hypothetical protein
MHFLLKMLLQEDISPKDPKKESNSQATNASSDDDRQRYCITVTEITKMGLIY